MSAATVPVKGPPGPPLPKLRPSGARLLALDGGGIKGVSALVVFEDIMNRVRDIEIAQGSDDHSDRRPVDYFDLAAGTSTGGLIALMLFRLRMTVQECQQEYQTLAKSIFAPVILGIAITTPGLFQLLAKLWLWFKSLWTGAVYSTKPLIQAIDSTVSRYPLDEQDKIKRGEAPLVNEKAGMMFMCSTLANKGESILFRSYNQPEDSCPVTDIAREAAENGYMNNASIQLGARATSAAPFFFPQVVWNPSGKPGKQMVYWDGGVLNNDPVDQLWMARLDLVGPRAAPPKVACVLSLGCSFDDPANFNLNKIFFVRLITAFSFVTNTKAKAHDFALYAQRLRGRDDADSDIRYFRFDADTKHKVFSIDDAGAIPSLEKATRQWIASSASVQKQLQECAELIARKD